MLKAIPDAPERTERQRQLVDDAAMLANDVQPDSGLLGYVILAAYADGTTRTAGYRPNIAEHQIGSSLWEAWIRQTLNSHIVYKESVDATYDVLNGEV